MVAEQEAGVSNLGEVGQEVPVRASHQHAGGEGLQLDGLDAQQEKIEHVGRKCPHAALFERQHGDLVMLIFKFCGFLGSFQLWTFTINY